MKSSIITFLLLAVLVIAACTAQKKVEYELPEEMLPHVKTEYAKRCDKGKILYDLACAGCHTVKEGRKQVIPDFLPEQLTGYTLRVSNRLHEKNMPDSLISEEELSIVMTFLTYKKKNDKK